MFNNGTVSKNSSYEGMCNKQFVNVRVAYSTYFSFGPEDNETNIMKEQDIDAKHGLYSQMSWDWEILKPFLMHHNILVKWVPCHAEYWGEEGALYKVLKSCL